MPYNDPQVTDLPRHTDPDFKNTLIFYSFSIIYLLITMVSLRDQSSEKDFQACFFFLFENINVLLFTLNTKTDLTSWILYIKLIRTQNLLFTLLTTNAEFNLQHQDSGTICQIPAKP